MPRATSGADCIGNRADSRGVKSVKPIGATPTLKQALAEPGKPDAVPPRQEPRPSLFKGRRRSGTLGNCQVSLVARDKQEVLVRHPGRPQISGGVWMCEIGQCVKVSCQSVGFTDNVGVSVDGRDTPERRYEFTHIFLICIYSFFHRDRP